MHLAPEVDPSFICKSSTDSQGTIMYLLLLVLRHSYYIYPKAIDSIEPKQNSRKFPIVVYDIREVDSIQVYKSIVYYFRKRILRLYKSIPLEYSCQL